MLVFREGGGGGGHITCLYLIRFKHVCLRSKVSRRGVACIVFLFVCMLVGFFLVFCLFFLVGGGGGLTVIIIIIIIIISCCFW